MRIHPVKQLKRDEFGKALCLWCEKKPVAKGRRKYCSDACQDEYYIRRNPAFARRKVRERDKGVCAKCGIDTNKEMRRFWKIEGLIGKEAALGIFAKAGYPNPPKYSTWWEMDHIIPVALGGGGCGLDNLRTLCWSCHKEATADLKRQLARMPKKVRQQKVSLFSCTL